jgi:hypothetical protein
MAANAGTKLHGKNGAIYLGGPKGSGIKVSAKTEWSLDLNRDYVESTSFGDLNKTYLVGLRDIQGRWAGLLDVSGDLLVNGTTSDSEYIYLYADDTNNNPSGLPILVAYGPGLIDASITSAVNDAMKTSGNFRASGNWIVFNSGTL